MLHLKWGESEKTLRGLNGIFNSLVKNEWLNDPFVKQMVKAIDNSTIVKDRYIESPILGAISPRELSRGVKGCTLMKYHPEFEYSGDAFGDNCARWILTISECQDVLVAFEHLMVFPQPFEIKVVNSGAVITTMRELIVEESKWVQTLNLPR